MHAEAHDVQRLVQAVQRIATYAEGMTLHYEQQGIGEARSWRVILHYAEEALGRQPRPGPPAGEPLERAPTDAELERLIRRCELLRNGAADLALPPAETHELLERLATDLLLWRHSHPGELPG